VSIGININCYSKDLPIKKQIELMKENGFETTFCMDNGEATEENIKEIKSAGIKFETIHAPLGNINNMWNNDLSGDEMFNRLLESVEKCSNFEIPVLVVHLSAGRDFPKINDRGNERYDRLMENAKKYGVKIAYENSRCLGNLAAALERYEDAYFCWDIGHEHCFTPGMKFLPYFADRVGAVHIHDNMCEFDKDIHIIPFDGKIDMERITSELARSSYKGSIMLELVRRASEVYADYTPEEYYKRAAEAARKIRKIGPC